MALNPAYAQQSTRALPFCLGYVYATGVKTNSMIAPDGYTIDEYVLAEGEWDGCAFLGTATSPLVVTSPTSPSTAAFRNQLWYGGNLPLHDGRYGVKGVPISPLGYGPDQSADVNSKYFPSVTPLTNKSGLAYYIMRYLTGQPMVKADFSRPVGIWRTTRCRFFDATGAVTGYGFTTNPTWQMIETILRYQVKRQQPPLAGLTNAERILFDWPAMFDHAARNAFVLANGAPRFAGNFAFAADAKLGAMMETQLRNCRSYKRVRNGQLAFVGDDLRPPVFTVSQRAVVPGTLKLQAKDISTAPNVYVPQYRETGIPAVCGVISATSQAGGETGMQTVFVTAGQQPFTNGDSFSYSGSDNEAQFAGNYFGIDYLDSYGKPIPPPISNQLIVDAGPTATGVAHGGYLGTEQSRFKQYAPAVMQHRAHQAAFAQVAPGISPLARTLKVFYDLGNNTFDQTNRIMRWLMIRDLGLDVSPYIPPNVGTLTVFAEAVDVDGKCAGEVESGDVITLDPSCDPTFAGDYVVQDPIVDLPPSRAADGSSSPGTRQLHLLTYQAGAYTDTSMPPGNSYQTLPGSPLPTADIPVANAFYLMQATPTTAFPGDGTVTFSVPDLSVWWMGQETPSTYTGGRSVTLAGTASGTLVILYLNLTDSVSTPTLTVDTSGAMPPVSLPPGRIVLFRGIPS